VFEFHLLVFNLTAVAFSGLDSDFFEGVVVTSIVVKFFIEEMDDFITCHIEELSSVRDDDHCTFAIADVVLEPHDGIKIQVIGGLVQ